MRVLHSVVLALTIVYTRAHLAYWAPNPLQAVQGLYVKPSSDGHTGDLYVAASEDNGVNSQWVADKPINFLPANHPQAVTYSSSYASNTSPGEEVVTTQKRAIFSSPTAKYTYASPASNDANGNALPSYPYALPASSGDPSATSYPYSLTGATSADGNNAAAAYPYAIPTAQSDGSPQYPADTAAVQPASPYYGYGYQYYYPYLISSMAAHTANALKAMGMSEEMANAVAAHTSMAMWTQMAGSAYGYPMQYAMPSAWAGQHAWAQSPAALTPSAAPATPTQQANTENA